MALMVTIDAETAERLGDGYTDGQTISMAEFDELQERIRAEKKREIAVGKLNDNKAQQVRRARLLVEAQTAYPEILADLQGRIPEGYVLTDADNLNVPSRLVLASELANSEAPAEDSKKK